MTTQQNFIPNREYKDRLFCFIFGNNKSFLLSLYNAVKGTHHTNEEDITITMFEDTLYVNTKDGTSFLFQTTMNPYEQQSTINPNMPLLSLISWTKLARSECAQEHHLNSYFSSLQKIPAPRCYVFYDGDKDAPEQQMLKLSDAFAPCGTPELNKGFEWTVQMINVNARKNQKLMEQCKPLEEYTEFIASIKEYSKRFSFKDAISRAVDDAGKLPCIGKFLQKFRNEVVNMLLVEF